MPQVLCLLMRRYGQDPLWAPDVLRLLGVFALHRRMGELLLEAGAVHLLVALPRWVGEVRWAFSTVNASGECSRVMAVLCAYGCCSSTALASDEMASEPAGHTLLITFNPPYPNPTATSNISTHLHPPPTGLSTPTPASPTAS